MTEDRAGPPTPRYTLREREEMAAREAGFDDPAPELARPASLFPVWGFVFLGLAMCVLIAVVLWLNRSGL